jgi:serine/tyrosine/threonine adenylyltransferase
MDTLAPPRIPFDNTFVRDLEGLYVPWHGTEVPAPKLLVFNEGLAAELGLDPDELRSPEGVQILVGARAPEGAQPVAQAYAGHQYAHFVPRLGDGRALLLGEVVDIHGRRRDLHLKGSGRTPFARSGDGKAVVGPMLREYVVGEAMYALGIPTTRALAVVATGQQIARETPLPGAVLTRVAASHIRVGTFQYAAAQASEGHELLRRLADYAIARHHPHAADAANPYLALLDAVTAAQADLIARWMCVGFIHGVMNTDNMTISGETIDYGPCAFMDAFDPATVFSSIDHGGRYAYGNQPAIGLWNLSRLAEALLPLVHADTDTAIAEVTAVLETFADRFRAASGAGMCAKLGLPADGPAADADLLPEWLGLLNAQRVDWTSAFRALSAAARGDAGPARALFAEPEPFDAWRERWLGRLAAAGDRAAAADAMDRVNPVYIPRNHLVEEALAAATAGDLGPVERLVEVLRSPYDVQPGAQAYASPASTEFGSCYRTFCGT